MLHVEYVKLSLQKQNKYRERAYGRHSGLTRQYYVTSSYDGASFNLYIVYLTTQCSV